MKKTLHVLGAAVIAALLFGCSTPAGTGVPTTTTTTTTDTSSTTSTGDSTTTATNGGSTTTATGGSSGGAASGSSGSGSGGSGSTVNPATLGPFNGHAYKRTNSDSYKYDFKSDGTMDSYYRTNASSDYEKRQIDNYEYYTSQSVNLLKTTTVKAWVSTPGNSSATPSLQTKSEVANSMLSSMSNPPAWYASYINALLEFQYFKETTYKVTENSGTYSLSEYTPQNVTGENLMAKQQMSGAIYNDPNTTYPYSSFTISGFFDSEVYSQMNTSMRSLFVNYYHSSDYNDTENWNKTASLTGLTETTATFKYTPTATNTGSSGSGTSSTPQTLTFNYTKTWNNGVATITLTPTNPEATAFLGRDSAQFSTRTTGFAMTLLNN